MDGLEQDSELIKELSRWAKKAPSRIAADLGMAATTLTRPANGKALTRISRATIEALREAFPSFPGWDQALTKPASKSVTVVQQPEVPPTRSADGGEIVHIQRLDLSLSMGPGTLIGDYVEAEEVAFDLAFIRAITRSSPSRLKLVTGIGDSMQPTLNSSDTIMVDTLDRQLAKQDGIYWIDLYGAAGLKRLRAIARDRVLVISDNPTVPDQEVPLEDLRIDGRAIWAAKGL